MVVVNLPQHGELYWAGKLNSAVQAVADAAQSTDAIVDAIETPGSPVRYALQGLISENAYIVPIYGNSLRNFPGTSTPVPLWLTVLWISNTAPVNRQAHDIWFEQGAPPPAGPADPISVAYVSSTINRGTGSTVTSATVAIPGGVQSGDLIVLTGSSMVSNNPLSVSSPLTFDSQGSNSRTGITSTLFTRVAGVGDAGEVISVTTPTAGALAVAVAVFRPSVPVLSAVATNQGGGSTSVVVPPFTPSPTSRAIHVIHLARGTGAAAALTPPTGMTLVASELPAGTAAPRSGIAFGLGAAPGVAVGNVWLNTSDHYASTWLIVLDVEG